MHQGSWKRECLLSLLQRRRQSDTESEQFSLGHTGRGAETQAILLALRTPRGLFYAKVSCYIPECPLSGLGSRT